jgi:putative ABC transport system permease protein
MISATSAIGGSFTDMLRRSVILTTGNWQSSWKGVPGSELEKITASPLIKDSLISHTVGFGLLPGSKNSQRPYIYITEYNSFDLSAITLKEGRLPENNTELVISSKMLDTSGVSYKIGDKVTFEIGERTSKAVPDTVLDNTHSYEEGELFTKTGEKQYTITGIVDASNKENLSRAGYAAFGGLSEDNIKNDETYTVYGGFHKINKAFYKNTEIIKNESKAQKVDYNNELLFYSGLSQDNRFMLTLKYATFIVGFIILLGSVSLIYNAFAISLTERSRTLGMLASVGATKQQKRNSVLFEAFLIGCIAIPVGLVCGYLGLGITFWLLNPIIQDVFYVAVPLKLIIVPIGCIGAILFSALLLMISAWFPAKRASKISPIDAIRQTQDVNIKGKSVKTLGITRKLFGFEAELGLKNIKRNKHRYYATLFSMIISIVLFLTASGFTAFINKSFTMSNAPINYDLTVSVYSDDNEEINRFQKELLNLNPVNNIVVANYINGNTDLLENQVSDEVKKRLGLFENGYQLELQIISMDDDSLRQYAKEAGVEYEALQSGSLKGILINTFNLKEGHKFTTVSQLRVKTGDTIPYKLMDDAGKSWETMIEVGAITDKIPLPVPGYQESMSNITMVVSERSMESLINTFEQKGDRIYKNSVVFYQTNSATKLEKDIETIKANYPGLSSYTDNVVMQRQRQERLSLIFSVFLYGFVILIAIVCTANIINTISTGIHMRKREFAMLKSYGITPDGFDKMIRYESIFYGLKSLLYGLPIGCGMIYLVYKTLGRNFDFYFFLPWQNIIIAVFSVFLVIGSTMVYAVRKTKKDNIIDTLKNENL